MSFVTCCRPECPYQRFVSTLEDGWPPFHSLRSRSGNKLKRNTFACMYKACLFMFELPGESVVCEKENNPIQYQLLHQLRKCGRTRQGGLTDSHHLTFPKEHLLVSLCNVVDLWFINRSGIMGSWIGREDPQLVPTSLQIANHISLLSNYPAAAVRKQKLSSKSGSFTRPSGRFLNVSSVSRAIICVHSYCSWLVASSG